VAARQDSLVEHHEDVLPRCFDERAIGASQPILVLAAEYASSPAPIQPLARRGGMRAAPGAIAPAVMVLPLGPYKRPRMNSGEVAGAGSAWTTRRRAEMDADKWGTVWDETRARIVIIGSARRPPGGYEAASRGRANSAPRSGGGQGKGAWAAPLQC